MTNDRIEDTKDIKDVRPASIVLISLFFLFAAFTAFWMLFKGAVTSSMANTLLLAAGGTTSLVCGVGFWLMKRWALYLYTVYGIINQIVLLGLGRWNIFSLLLLAVVLYFGYKNRSEMS